ncbi:hypothetical protein [Paralysiella testudinis]|uniref:Uncharacterized protein n=1 Tax=Paralysiella testudinis TaxID=2809020 RepID=A0A892ZIY8_9NEIS|nr:hypothetical protein [Paralysiella testudinis]QRQ81797.1 hypothetical protein JQU52_14195 [Paralysiella testudinis]
MQSPKFTVYPDTRTDSHGQPIQGWLAVCQGREEPASCFFPTYLIIFEDCELDHGFESACLFGKRYIQAGGL